MKKFELLVYKILGTFFGLGYSPVASGTVGSLGAILVCYILHHYLQENYNLILLFLILFFFIIGVYVSGKLEAIWGVDPSEVVIDEVVGMWISLFLIPFNIYLVMAAFLLFRLFDIFKPLLIRKIEKLKGGWGIMGDDALAAIYSNVFLQLIIIASPVIKNL
jgi:phosphatidylglycerophosphatase A